MAAPVPLPPPTQVVYKKQTGILTLSAHTLAWTPSGPSPIKPVSERIDYVKTLLASPPGSAKSNMKILFYPPSSLVDSGLKFDFNGPEDLDAFKEYLKITAALNKERMSSKMDGLPAGVTPNFAKGKGKDPRENGNAAHGGGVKQEAVDYDMAPLDYDLHKRVLMKNPQLATLHQELVMSGSLTEKEFWEGRELVLLSEQNLSSQTAGRSSQLLDDRFSGSTAKRSSDLKNPGKDKAESSGGPQKIVLTEESIRELFEEFPVVKKAHSEAVPKIPEAEFWQRFFVSKLWERQRASVRSAQKSTAKADELFDKYLEDPDDGLEPRQRPRGSVSRFLDLAATEVDHYDSGQIADVTMQPGKTKSSLPLMRRFNEHSEKLLKHALDEEAEDESTRKRKKENGKGYDSTRDYQEIDLEDLHTISASTTIPLKMTNFQSYFNATSSSVSFDNGNATAVRSQAVLQGILIDTKMKYEDWQPHLAELKMDPEGTKEVCNKLTASVKSRTDSRNRKGNISPKILEQMLSFHSATNEFLRQFWFAILPTPPNALGAAKMSQVDKQMKASKMIKYLLKTEEKVEGLMAFAREKGGSGQETMVRDGLGPTIDAVNKAIEFWEMRKK